MITYLLVFIAAFLGDVGWTMYFKEVARDRAIPAALWSGFIILCGGYSVYEYAHNIQYLIASIMGSVAGVWWTMRWKTIFKRHIIDWEHA